MDRPWLALALVLFLAPPMPLATQTDLPTAQVDAGDISDVAKPAVAVPASGFIENAGQLADGSIRFYTAGPVSAAFTDTGVLFRAQGPERVADYAMRFARARAVRPTGLGALPGTSNFILGNDPSGWRTGVATYEALVYADLYAGIDLRFLVRDGNLKYEFVVRPGGDPAGIRLEFSGARPSICGDSLFLDTPAGRISDSGFTVYQGEGAGRIAVDARMVAAGSGVGYEIGSFDRSSALVIDPVISSTVIGGGGDDYAIAMTVDRFNNAYLAGETLSIDFPATPNAWSNRSRAGNSTFDLIVVKLAPDGTRALFSTYIGSSGNDFAHDLRVDESGFVYVTGYTYGFDFPVTNGSFDPTYNGYGDVFVLKLSPTGTTLVLSTFIGGDDVDFGYAMALGPDTSMYVAGGTLSIDFPTTAGAFQPSIRTGSSTEDGFVLRLAANGSALEYCTYLGGEGLDHVLGIQADGEGHAFVTGTTSSPDFPTTEGAFSRVLQDQDAFVARLDPSGSSLEYSTFLGGSGTDIGNALAIDGSGGCYVTGDTNSYNFPVVFEAATGYYHGKWDCFAARLDETGARLAFSGYLGGSGDDNSAAILVDDGGNVTVAGTTSSADIATTPAAEQRALPGRRSLLVARLDPSAQRILYASYLGGHGDDACAGAALDAAGHVCLAGTTASADFPGAPAGTPNGTNVFLVRLAPVCVPGPPAMRLSTGSHAVFLNWTEPEMGAGSILGYVLYRGLQKSALNITWRIPAEVSDFSDERLDNGIYYYYALSAVNASGEGERSTARTVMPGIRPSAPRNLTAAGRPSRVILSWQAPELTYDLPVLKYRLFSWNPGTASQLLAEVVNVTMYVDLRVYNDFAYFYQVSAVNIIGESDPSEEAFARPSERPSPPQNLTAYLNGRAVTLSWDTPDNPGIGLIEDYFVYYQFEDGRRKLVGRTPVRLYVDRELLAGTYRYRVAANSTVGEGYLSEELSVNITNLPPVAGYTVNALEGTTGQPFAFSSTSYDRDTYIVNYTWQFGDGNRSNKQDPTHYFPRRGLYNITLRVRDVDGAEANTTGMISVLNTPPSIGAYTPGAYTLVYRGRSREFSITPLDPDADQLETAWSLNGSASGKGHKVRITFNLTGSYVLTATLSDGEATSRTSWNVTVVPAPPPPPARSSWSGLLGAALAAAVVVSGLAAFWRRAARHPAAPRVPQRNVRKRVKRPAAPRPRPGKKASQKPIIRKRYS